MVEILLFLILLCLCPRLLNVIGVAVWILAALIVWHWPVSPP